jgi:hypothetical protein
MKQMSSLLGPMARQRFGQQSESEVARSRVGCRAVVHAGGLGLRPASRANETSHVRNPGVRRAWNAGEQELKGVPDRWRLYWVG